MSLKASLREIDGMYSTVRARQHGLNKRHRGESIKYKGGLEGLEDAYDFKFSAVHISEDVVEITFLSDADGETDECVDWISLKEFYKHFETMD